MESRNIFNEKQLFNFTLFYPKLCKFRMVKNGYKLIVNYTDINTIK